MAEVKSNFQDMLDIIFSNRNKKYGAYKLRREYPTYVSKALIGGLLLIVLFFVGPYIYASINDAFGAKAVERDVIAELGPPPEIDPNLPPPPPPPPVITPPPPVRTTVAFVPPVVKKDDQVKNDPPPPAQADITVQVDDKTKKGDDKLPPPPPKVPDNIPLPPPPPPPPVDDQVYDFVEKQASFPGGEAELQKFLRDNIKYPPLAKEAGTQGRVILKFLVNKDGSIQSVTILKDIGGGCGKEAVRVVQNMPKWVPGEQNGRPVKVNFTLPVLFKLE